MISKINSLGLSGVSGYVVTAECFLSSGLPGFEIVGLPDSAVKESRERIRAAVKNCGFKFPVSKITINLAPADTKKAGTVYDLPLLLGILSAGKQITPIDEDTAVFGELSLDGQVRPVQGALPMAIAATRLGFKKLIVPFDNAAEAAFAEGIEVYPVKTVAELLEHLSGEKLISPAVTTAPAAFDVTAPDFSDVKGQESVKRA